MRKSILLFTILLVVTLSGCSIVEANRIYTVCQIENGVSIAYNNSMEFVQVKDGVVLPHSGAGVTAKPVLSFYPEEGDYVITPTEIPNRYRATLEALEHYVSKLVSIGAEYEIAFSSWRELDIYVHYTDWHCRCLWDIDGNLRLYFIDIYNNTMEPLYLNEEI